MEINKDKLPSHVAIIMDGNGRWAKKRFMPRNFGHKQGAKILTEIVLHANEIGIKYLTVYAFSTENWKRPKEEVEYLMKLPLEFFETFHKKFEGKNIRLMVIGSREGLPKELVEKIEKIELETKENTALTFLIAFNYGGRAEIIHATKQIISDVVEKRISKSQITEEVFERYLYTKDIPDVDLMIRTSGESRISNFLIWQLSYSELYFTTKLWPDFSKKELNKALEFYSKCSRRFGGLK